MSKAIEYCKNVFDGTHDTPKPTESGYKLLTSKNILNGNLDKANAYFISKEDYEAINKRSKVQQWDVLFSMIGTVGNVCLITEENIDFAIKNMGVFSCEDEKKAKWLYYYLQSPYAKQLMKNYLNGAIQKFLPLEWLRNLQIPDYDSSKENIVQILWSIDSKIVQNNSVYTELESMAKTLYDYWFTQFDFPNEEGKPYRSSGGAMEWNEQLKREIPKGWEAGQLSDIANITMGQSPAGETYNEDGNGTIFYQGCTDFGTRFPVPRVYTTAPTRFAQAGDILMSVRAPVGTLNVAIEDCSIGRGLAALNSKIGSQLYLWYTLAGFKQLFSVLDGNGTTFGSITKDALYGMKVVIPNPTQVRAFEKIVQPIEQKIRVIEEENRELTKLRDWLLPMLMNGQATVCDSEQNVVDISVKHWPEQQFAVRQAARIYDDTKPDDTADLIKAYLKRKENES